MKKFYITGVSGTGKSTAAEALAERGVHTVDLDAIEGLCRWVNKESGEISHWHPGIGAEFFETYKYVCDRQKLIELMGDGEDVVVVGLADNWPDIQDLFDKVFLFHCDEEVFMRRIRERTNHDFGKHESEQEMIRGWYREFEKEMMAQGAVPIDASQPTDAVINRVLKELHS